MHSCSTGMQYLRGPSFDLLQAPSAKLEDLPTVLATRAAGKMRWASCFVPLLIVLSLMLALRCDNCMLILLAWLPNNMISMPRLVKKSRDVKIAAALRVSVSTLTSARHTSLPAPKGLVRTHSGCHRSRGSYSTKKAIVPSSQRTCLLPLFPACLAKPKTHQLWCQNPARKGNS